MHDELIDWSPLCGHLALNEGVRGDLELTPHVLSIDLAGVHFKVVGGGVSRIS